MRDCGKREDAEETIRDRDVRRRREEGEKPAAAVPPPAPQVTQQPTAAASTPNETVTPEVVK